MQNLSVENLSKTIELGDAQGLVGPDRMAPGKISERAVEQAMQENGMRAPDVSTANPADGKSFSDLLRQSVDQVNQYQIQADQAVSEMIAGRTKNIHETMLAVERADISLKLMMQVRNKVIDAYREIMKMQI